MKRILYSVYDAEKKATVAYFEATSARKVIRDNWRFFKKVNPYFYEDWLIAEVATLLDDGRVDPSSARWTLVSWDEYDLTEAKAQPMTSEQISELKSQ